MLQPSLFGRYPDVLGDEDRERLFEMWMCANPEAVGEMVEWAYAIDRKGMPVSVQYLFEKERYEGTARLVPVPFTTESGERREYGINHNDRALFGRWLKEKHPALRVTTRKSRWDA
ncbi:MAG: hypothetical protein J6D54_13570 [Olsenella sp.]|nr:hypothetical protein [Olsenella sp.]